MLVFRDILRTYLMDDPLVEKTDFRNTAVFQSCFSLSMLSPCSYTVVFV